MLYNLKKKINFYFNFTLAVVKLLSLLQRIFLYNISIYYIYNLIRGNIKGRISKYQKMCEHIVFFLSHISYNYKFVK